MARSAPRPPTDMMALARAVLARAWPRDRPPATPGPAVALVASLVPRRDIAHDELAEIDAMRLLISPAFAAAMARSAARDRDERAAR